MRDTTGYKSRPSFIENLLAMVLGCMFLSLPFLLPVAAVGLGIGAGYKCAEARICNPQGVKHHVKNQSK